MITLAQLAAALNPRRAVKRRNVERQAKDFPRKYGSVERVAWVAARRCLVARTMGAEHCKGPAACDNAHVGNGGGSRKADAKHIVPLCRFHHAQLHNFGAETFQRGYEVSLADEAAKVDADWKAFQGVA
jgi:hypothetical protein